MRYAIITTLIALNLLYTSSTQATTDNPQQFHSYHTNLNVQEKLTNLVLFLHYWPLAAQYTAHICDQPYLKMKDNLHQIIEDITTGVDQDPNTLNNFFQTLDKDAAIIFSSTLQKHMSSSLTPDKALEKTLDDFLSKIYNIHGSSQNITETCSLYTHEDAIAYIQKIALKPFKQKLLKFRHKNNHSDIFEKHRHDIRKDLYNTIIKSCPLDHITAHTNKKTHIKAIFQNLIEHFFHASQYDDFDPIVQKNLRWIRKSISIKHTKKFLQNIKIETIKSFLIDDEETSTLFLSTLKTLTQ